MNCPKCGKQNADGAKFCIKCGSSLEGPASNADASPALAAVPEEQSILKNKIFLVALAVVFIVLAAGGISSSSQSTPSGAVKKMIKSIEAGNYSSYRNSYSAEGLEMANTLSFDLKVFLEESKKKVEQKEGIKEIEITKETIKGDEAEVCYKIEYGNKSIEETCDDLVKENGDWKIPF
ncbi:MAG: zinc-ribbon domain-containing protein [Candidatus Paceibacterota bacterium]|jgi:uncharacterized membrane protein YvbJ